MSNATSMKVGGRPPQQDSRCGGVEMQVAAVTHPGTTTSGSGGWDWKKKPSREHKYSIDNKNGRSVSFTCSFPMNPL